MPPSSENRSVSTFGDYSTNPADYPEVGLALARAPPPEMAPADDRTPNSQERIPEVYDTNLELLVRGRQWIADLDFPLGFTVDASRQAVASLNAPARSRPRQCIELHSLLSKALTGWPQLGAGGYLCGHSCRGRSVSDELACRQMGLFPAQPYLP
jgi:hypothetical protein